MKHYTYAIISIKYYNLRIDEFINDKYFDSWNINQLKGTVNDFKDRTLPSKIESFNRTQKWLKENHLEMLL